MMQINKDKKMHNVLKVTISSHRHYWYFSVRVKQFTHSADFTFPSRVNAEAYVYSYRENEDSHMILLHTLYESPELKF